MGGGHPAPPHPFILQICVFHLVPMKSFFICYIYMRENLYPQFPVQHRSVKKVSTLRWSENIIKTFRILRKNILKSNGNIRMLTTNYYMHPQAQVLLLLVSGVSTIGTAFTLVGLPLSASLAIVSTVSTCVGACLLLTSKKYKKKLLKCYELLDKITTSLATFETLISLSIDDGSVIDAKEFQKLQTFYLQLMAHIRNIDRKMKVQTEENFQKTIMDEIVNLKKALEQK